MPPSETASTTDVQGGIPPELRVARVMMLVQAVLFVPAGLAMLAALRSSSALLPHYALLPMGLWLLVSGAAIALLAVRLPGLSHVDRYVATAIEVTCVAIGVAFAQGVGLGAILFGGVLYELWIPRAVRAAYRDRQTS